MRALILIIGIAAILLTTSCESGVDSDSDVVSEGHTEMYADNSYMTYNEDNSTVVYNYTYNEIVVTNDTGILTNEFEDLESEE